MIVAFLHAKQEPIYAEMMVRSVRRHMGCRIVQLTDETTPQVKGTDEVRRLHWASDNPMFLKINHLSKMEEEALVLDTDVLVRADVSSIFSLPFDMALTYRSGPILDPNGVDVAKKMPINCGVMFQRNRFFWHDCMAWIEGKDVGWYADQLACAAVAPYYNVLRLHCENFNYTPPTSPKVDRKAADRLIVHYKGNRKPQMIEAFNADY